MAKVLANPKTGLILDEPTNDLDLETLDLLTEMLTNYNGTLLIVSHDRDFLDQTVNKILHFKEDGNVSLFFGGYSDFLKSKNQQVAKNTEIKKSHSENNKVKNSKTKLSYKFQYELEQLPGQIKKIQQELEDIKNELKDTNLYLENFERYQEITSKMEVLNSDLNTKENRWYELIKMEEGLVSN